MDLEQLVTQLEAKVKDQAVALAAEKERADRAEARAADLEKKALSDSQLSRLAALVS